MTKKNVKNVAGKESGGDTSEADLPEEENRTKERKHTRKRKKEKKRGSESEDRREWNRDTEKRGERRRRLKW